MESAEIEEAVKELETRLDRLRALYEQYFMGIEKLEPLVPRKDVERRFQALRKEQIRNTAMRFRFHMTLQKYNTYQTYWIRICRQIEEGTYKRDVLRAKAKAAEQARREKRDGPTSFDLTGDVEDLEDGLGELLDIADAPRAAPPPLHRPSPAPSVAMDAARPAATLPEAPAAPRGFGAPPKATQSRMKMLAVRLKAERDAAAKMNGAPAPHPAPNPAPPAPAAASERRMPAAPPVEAARPRPEPRAEPRPAAAAGATNHGRADLSDERVRQLYGQYVEARRKQNESTAALTYESMARTLRESSAKLREKHQGKAVDFEVTVKDGKTVLKPVVK